MHTYEFIMINNADRPINYSFANSGPGDPSIVHIDFPGAIVNLPGLHGVGA